MKRARLRWRIEILLRLTQKRLSNEPTHSEGDFISNIPNPREIFLVNYEAGHIRRRGVDIRWESICQR
jgi:hypothetical protein